MKRSTFVQRLTERGYWVEISDDGLNIYDRFGWRAFVSDIIRLGVNTCSQELPNDDYNLINRYIRTPLDKR